MMLSWPAITSGWRTVRETTALDKEKDTVHIFNKPLEIPINTAILPAVNRFGGNVLCNDCTKNKGCNTWTSTFLNTWRRPTYRVVFSWFRTQDSHSSWGAEGVEIFTEVSHCQLCFITILSCLQISSHDYLTQFDAMFCRQTHALSCQDVDIESDVPWKRL